MLLEFPGLLNVSGTKLQRNGAIHGEGIYLSTDPQVALHFCTAGELWDQSCLAQRARFLLLCEVANGSDVLRSTSTDPAGFKQTTFDDDANGHLGTYVIVKNKDMLRIRYIWMYCEPSRLRVKLSANSRVGPGNKVGARGFGGWDVCQFVFVAYIAVLVVIFLSQQLKSYFGLSWNSLESYNVH